MPENWVSDFMAMCCGLSLAVALGWNVTAGAADWKQLAENLCLVQDAQTASVADGACQAVAQSGDPTIVVASTLTP
jgi:hypothetical protein